MNAELRAKQKFDRASVCDKCFRPREECICGTVPSFDNRLAVVILQHPQERLKALNSARLAHLLLKNSRVFVGLSWPNFRKVAGEGEQPSLWGVLYLNPERHTENRPISIVNRKKQPVADASFLRGIIAIDGSWKQAKTLWWRNPWLLRLNRISLNAGQASLRPQVKSEGLSTIEAVAFALECLGETPQIGQSLRRYYKELIIR